MKVSRRSTILEGVGRKYSVVSWICSGFADGDVPMAAPDPRPPRTDRPAPHRLPAVPGTDHRGTRAEP
jgi:hypothetical protein